MDTLFHHIELWIYKSIVEAEAGDQANRVADLGGSQMPDAFELRVQVLQAPNDKYHYYSNRVGEPMGRC